jgi:uncharacterized protein YecE (DUF72 family)
MADSSAGTVEDTPPMVRIGCAGLPQGMNVTSYFKRLDLLEVDATFYDPPALATLRRWQREAPPGAGFSAVAWQLVTHDADTPGYARLQEPLPAERASQVGSFRPTPAVRDAWQRTLASARALAAEVVLLSSPPSFAPTAQNRDALRRFVGEVIGDVPDLTIAWEPRGVWEPGPAASLAAELGLVYVCDPLQLEVPPPQETRAYFRIYGLGFYRDKISEENLELLAAMVERHERCWVVFANTSKLGDAQRFRALWEGRAPHAG